MKPPTLALTGTSTATAYRFRVADPRDIGWAICTVNDATGELTIQSDWGCWSHRWNVAHLGGGATLTQFIADRPADRSGVHYLVGKLTSDRDRQIDEDATIADCLEVIIRRRREGDLTKDEAREAWDWLVDSKGELAACDTSATAWQYSMPGEVHDALGGAVYECIREEPTTSARVLAESILPALVEACKAAAGRPAAPAEATTA